ERPPAARTHTLSLHDALPISDDVARITMSRPGVRTLTGPRHPTTLIEVAHSPAYFLAAGVADRDFSWIHASPEKIADPVIGRLRSEEHTSELQSLAYLVCRLL